MHPIMISGNGVIFQIDDIVLSGHFPYPALLLCIVPHKKTVCLLGMRADESLQRYSGFLNKKYGYKGECWISQTFKEVWCASPLYDWSSEDIWRFMPKFNGGIEFLYIIIAQPCRQRIQQEHSIRFPGKLYRYYQTKI